MPAAPSTVTEPDVRRAADAPPLTRRAAIAAERAASRGAVSRIEEPSVASVAPPERRVRAVVPRPSQATARSAPHRTRATHVPAPIAPRHPVSTGRAIRSASTATAAAVILFVAGLVVATSVPANAFTDPAGTTSSASVSTGARVTQSIDAGVAAAGGDTSRDGYTVTTPVAPSLVSATGTFTNDPNGTIQWPFLVGVPITSGFGARSIEGCSFCSTFHEGADFAPGAGTPIRSVAAGMVIKVQANDGGYGNDVWVQHDVDGKQFVSVYGHMQDNSFMVTRGQVVTVGQQLGLVGSTGNSTGPHLHLEIHVDGVPVDPVAWLKANAN